MTLFIKNLGREENRWSAKSLVGKEKKKELTLFDPRKGSPRLLSPREAYQHQISS